MTAPLLEIDQLTVRFGGLTAVSELDLNIEPGEILALIGPNGAGKTTAFNAITGVVQPTSGEVRFEGAKLPAQRPHHVTKLGIARTFQNIRLFDNMTALENVLVGVHAQHKSSVVGAILGLPQYRREEREGHARAYELLEFVGIRNRAEDAARNLSYGEQRRLEIARALGTSPRLLLLDEPAAGTNPSEKAALATLIRDVRDTGVTVLLIEHDMSLVMRVSDRVSVLDFGQKIAEGVPAAVQRDPAVVRAYLGGAADAS